MNPRLRYLIGTVVLLAIGLGYALIQGRPHVSLPRPATQSVAAARPAPPPPSARTMLDRAQALDLSAEQRKRLEALDREWRQESSGLESAVKVASQDFARYMADAQKGGRVSLEDIQRHSEDVRELSAALRERRRLHAEAAARVLTEPQRRELGRASSPEPPGGTR